MRRARRGQTRILGEAEHPICALDQLATLRTEVPPKEDLADLEWRGADRRALGEVCERTGDSGLLERIPSWLG